MSEETLYRDRMCKAMSMGPVLIPEMLSAKGLKHLCNQVNGKVFLVKDDETRQTSTLKRLGLALLKTSSPKCDGNSISNINLSNTMPNIQILSYSRRPNTPCSKVKMKGRK